MAFVLPVLQPCSVCFPKCYRLPATRAAKDTGSRPHRLKCSCFDSTPQRHRSNVGVLCRLPLSTCHSLEVDP